MAQYHLSVHGCTKLEIVQWLKWIWKERPSSLADFVCIMNGSGGKDFCKHGKWEYVQNVFQETSREEITLEDCKQDDDIKVDIEAI